MQVNLNPYITFDGNAREAMEFYQSVFGGKLEVHTFKQYHASSDPSDDDKVMHSMLTCDNGIMFMGADVPKVMAFDAGKRISVTLSGDDNDTLSGYYEKLSAGGTGVMPLNVADWGDKFGMFTDKFGVSWMVNISLNK